MKHTTRSSPISNILPKNRTLIRSTLINCIIILSISIASQAQVVSHELRRLAVATNQFGIDSLKALDRIEPPDKVIVFCPVCLSSTLVMIMMGSSKYQVVSSLRHALYIWSMRPQDINRGFKDVFEHIGLNQNHQHAAPAPQSVSPSSDLRATGSSSKLMNSTTKTTTKTSNQINTDEIRLHSVKQQHMLERSLTTSGRLYSLEALSLPKLIKLKEILEVSATQERPWWHSMSRRFDGGTVDDVGQTKRGNKTLEHQEFSDLSRMSAMSNVYIQRGLTMNYNYNLLLRQYYKTVIHPVDFLRNAEETRQHINSLVAANTEGKIKDLVKRGSFDPRAAPKIMMISTFHFRGTLDIEMRSKNESASSQVQKGRSSSRRLQRKMSQESIKKPRQQQQAKAKGPPPFIETEATLLKYGHFTTLDCSVIEIPFNNRLVTLVIVMPDHQNVTELLVTRLSAQVLSDMINSLVVKRLSLGIPVIKFDRGPINTEGLLRELGLDNLFLGNQTFSTETGLNRWMRPSDILHETSIDIGTMNPNWSQTEDRLKVGAHESRSAESNYIKLDKPFFYFVVDSINGLILTMGRIRQQ